MYSRLTIEKCPSLSLAILKMMKECLSGFDSCGSVVESPWKELFWSAICWYLQIEELCAPKRRVYFGEEGM